MPREWRDAKLVADERKEAGKFINEYNKSKLATTIKKAEEDSDDDDLAGWHLDWTWLVIEYIAISVIKNSNSFLKRGFELIILMIQRI